LEKRFWLATVMLAGCKLDLRDGDLLCNHNGKTCPDGYHCAGDDRCYQNGHDPDLSAIAMDLAGESDILTVDSSENPDLTPVKKQADPCVAGMDVCSTGHCVDGYCCNSECTDSCAACDVSGSLGMCTAVSGPPHGARNCTGSGTCGGKCNGATTTCAYPTSQVICGAACDGQCDGTGGCSVATSGTCPNGFACGTNACLTSCSGDGDCQQPNFKCQAPNCVRVPESDCLDGIDNNGDGQVDCADPTCTSVICVPGVGVGNEVGVFTAASCPADYGPAQALHQTLIVPSCSACGCTPIVTCTATVSIRTDTNCGASVFASAQLTTVELQGSGVIGHPCGNLSSPWNGFGNNVYATWSAPMRMGLSTASAGSSSASGASWDSASSMSFCPARISPSQNACAPAHVCVRMPSPAPACARVPGVDQACPGDYSSGTHATWYSDFTDAHSCSCDNCTVTNHGDCGGSIGSAWLSANNCTANPNDINDGLNYIGGGASCAGVVGTRVEKSVYPTTLGAQNAACSCSATLNNPATRTGASTICCQ
jgi:hypothetical protein